MGHLSGTRTVCACQDDHNLNGGDDDDDDDLAVDDDGYDKV